MAATGPSCRHRAQWKDGALLPGSAKPSAEPDGGRLQELLPGSLTTWGKKKPPSRNEGQNAIRLSTVNPLRAGAVARRLTVAVGRAVSHTPPPSRVSLPASLGYHSVGHMKHYDKGRKVQSCMDSLQTHETHLYILIKHTHILMLSRNWKHRTCLNSIYCPGLPKTSDMTCSRQVPPPPAWGSEKPGITIVGLWNSLVCMTGN